MLRPFFAEDPAAFVVKDHSRAQRIVDRLIALDASVVASELTAITAKLDAKHRDTTALFRQRFNELEGINTDRSAINVDQALLIGAYFTEEFSFESAALFNPSIVRSPDQSGQQAGALRFLLSLRGIGEGHVSSVTFRSGTWHEDGSVIVDAPSKYAVPPTIDSSRSSELGFVVHVSCAAAKDISETVIFPFLPSQGKGIEDVRMVEFTEDDGARDWRATFTAFDGAEVRQALFRTDKFETFTIQAIVGQLAKSKGAALFPRPVGGRYLMLGRPDNENIWLFSSDDFRSWSNGRQLLSPRFPWEFVQLGNCGSPIEIDEGWLVLTHGVGVARNYAIGACLLDKDDPMKVLGRLSTPLLAPTEMDRAGYVPNVVYSCGALLRGRSLLLPYGVADTYSAFAVVEIDGLLAAMK
ncbi:glycoside hydrolase family 130 protein [Polymorphobacter megasporae]|uniref:glycoside hydrolase family 130 protein n=1 Tax=Glacieibacterium megasporae TaxID=2835787 RepID=UPI002106C8F0|nr:glycoside hydrolase family 130 protein [Polymorphobacter megasporae]